MAGPTAPAHFVKRHDELDQLDRLTTATEPGGAAVVMLTGTPGVGKTALTRYWAHRNYQRFSDGQLHTDFGKLRQGVGVAVSDVLGDFLMAFDVPNESIPAGLAQRSDMFRSATHGRRLLIVLDNAENEAEVTRSCPVRRRMWC